ncbi:MAG TPA: TIGR04500 family putative peptide maturation system protein [Kofleriaceae bacterium]|jgi:putative peptide maturation system protein
MIDRDPDIRILAAVTELRALARAGATPADARARIAAVAGPGAELVHERDAAGPGYHFDAILEEPGGAVTLRYCPDRGMPFALRGAERLSDRDLVEVDGEVLPVAQAIALLDFVWSERPVLRRLLDVCLIQAALRAEPVEVDAAAVQTALDRIRVANGLYSAAETQRWMAERGLSHEALEAHAADQAAILALRDRVVGARLTAELAADRAEYDAATLARIVVPDDAEHHALVERAAAERLGIAAVIGLVVAAGRAAPGDDLAIARVRRRELGGALRDAVFERPIGQVHAVRDAGRLVLVHVFARHAAELDGATAELIAAELFDAWLAERRAAARIVWNWGSADRTAAATAPEPDPA